MSRKYPQGLTFYQDVRGQWRWRVVSENGRILGVSSESYHNESECREGAKVCGEILVKPYSFQ